MKTASNSMHSSTDRAIDQAVDSVRHFNRFYTRQIGVLQQGLLASAYSLTEARVLYEIANTPSSRAPTATALRGILGVDAGYLSRILGKFEAAGLVRRNASQVDTRQSDIALTAKGRRAFATLDTRSRKEAGAQLAALRPTEAPRLVAAMQTIESLLAPRSGAAASWMLRAHRPGDIGWIVHRQATLYHAEYGWNEEFEALVAEIAAQFIRNFDARREHCWIAERDGAIVGAVFLVKESSDVAKLRMLYVEPSTRGMGIGRRLVAECVSMARRVGYKTLTLWTNDVLHAARHLYQEAGFTLEKKERHKSFGKKLVGQYWTLELT